MSKYILKLLQKQLISEIENGPDLVLLLAHWFDLELAILPDEPSSGGLWKYQLVSDTAIRELAKIPTNYSFVDGLKYLKQKEYFVANKIPGFEADPLAIFCIAMSIKIEESNIETVSWLNKLITLAEIKEQDQWRKDLLNASSGVLSNKSDLIVNPIIKVALALKGVVNITPEEIELARKMCFDLSTNSSEKALFKLAALKNLLQTAGNIRLGSIDTDDVTQLLKGVESGLKRWVFEDKPKTKKCTTQKWDIQNEYHVQSLLWSLLRPLFSDLKDEEYLQSIGYKHPRVDLAIPSLRLIIEVKYLRSSVQSSLAKITEEIAADANLYLNGNDFDQIIVFVWDHSASVQHHESLVQGFIQFPGIKDAVIVSRPGNWR